jgi:hypothetical protein
MSRFMTETVKVTLKGELIVEIVDGPDDESHDYELIRNVVDTAYADAAVAFKNRLRDLKDIEFEFNEGQRGIKYRVIDDA